VSMATASIQTVERENYLNKHYGVGSWLFTTDHKRIALLYLLSITIFFFIGGFLRAAHSSGIADSKRRPGASRHLQQAVHHARHGDGFLFLVPSIPAVLGNFLVPLMIGAKDLAFPKINLLSWFSTSSAA